MIGAVNEDFALWGGVALIVISCLFGLIALKYKGGNQLEGEGKPNVIKDTEINVKAKHVVKAIGADFEGDYELEGVKVKLEADNVEQATGARFTSTNGSTPLTGMIMSCSSCGKMFPKAFTGHLPKETACPHCGHMNKVGNNK